MFTVRQIEEMSSKAIGGNSDNSSVSLVLLSARGAQCHRRISMDRRPVCVGQEESLPWVCRDCTVCQGKDSQQDRRKCIIPKATCHHVQPSTPTQASRLEEMQIMTLTTVLCLSQEVLTSYCLYQRLQMMADPP